jgi:hypothetical protein
LSTTFWRCKKWKALDQDASRFKCATDEKNGNEVLGSVNIEGKLDIGLIWVETKGIEVVAERTIKNLIIATDIRLRI